VLNTPGHCQNFRSAPQKQPIPNKACSIVSGNGGTIGLPVTKCLFVTGMGAFRPGKASLGSGRVSFFDEKIMACGIFIRLFGQGLL